MQGGNQMNATPARPGLVVIDVSLNVVACNADAIQILTFPDNPEKINDLRGWLTKKIHSSLVDAKSTRPSFVGEFLSAKRMHLCRAFPLTAATSPSSPHPVVVLMLERKSPEHFTMAEISKRFGLTPREQETARLLGEGLTSKEIATRMNISPNTVNSFVRLMMVKMNVSSRSAIIGKIVAPKG
jgi:DNA-binding CsgD family transcriptional regulator